MAHQITRTDTFVGYLTGGWHGLGKKFDQVVRTPEEAVKLAGLGWSVDQLKLHANRLNGPGVLDVASHVLNVRSDNSEPLGVVGAGYVPCQNIELARFAFEVAKCSGGDLKLETAGSLRGGRRVWFLLSGVRFDAAGNANDPIDTFLLAANGHDGGLGIWNQPTSTRVVCANTLHMAMSSAKRFIRLRHEGDLMKKIAEAQAALKVYGASVNEFKQQVAALSAKDVNRDAINDFFIEAWTRTEFAIPKNPKTEEEQRKRERATAAYTAYAANVDADAAKIGRKGKPTLWNAFNGFTQFVQHQKTVRGKDDNHRLEARVFNDLCGSTSNAKQVAFAHALSLV